jgi:hypothetical protein
MEERALLIADAEAFAARVVCVGYVGMPPSTPQYPCQVTHRSDGSVYI